MTGFERIRSLGTCAVVAIALVSGACGGSSKPGGAAGTSGGAAGTGSAGTGSGGTTGTSGSGGATTFTGTPVQLCQQLIKTICTRLQSCPGVLTDPTTFNETQCETDENIEFGCARATDPGFPTCLMDVTTISCASLFDPTAGLQLPNSCNTPLNAIPLSAAQSACAALALTDCTRIAMCLGVTPSADQLQQCQAADYSSAGCGVATAQGATYDQCNMALMTAPCPPDGGADGGTNPDADIPACDTALTFAM
jgi:hypothetical protein